MIVVHAGRIDAIRLQLIKNINHLIFKSCDINSNH